MFTGRGAQSVSRLTQEPDVARSIASLATFFSPSADLRRTKDSCQLMAKEYALNTGKYLGNSVAGLNDRLDMTRAV